MKHTINSFFLNTKKGLFRTGAVIIFIVVVFSYILPVFYPYGQTDVFYTTKSIIVDSGVACLNNEYRFYPVDSGIDIPTELILHIENISDGREQNDEFTVGDAEYKSGMIVENVYSISSEDVFLGIISTYVIDFYEGIPNDNYVELFLTADDKFKVYDKSGITVGELSEYIIRDCEGNDSFNYEQKQEIKDVLFGNTPIDNPVYLRTLDSEVFISKNTDSMTFSTYLNRTLINTYAKPSPDHLLGTDANGMDVLARLMYGGRISLIVGSVSAIIGIFIGTLLGFISGLRTGFTDVVLMRLVDIFDSLPSLPLLLIAGTLITDLFISPGMSIVVMIFFIAVFSWSQIARIVRIKVIELNLREDIIAADIAGIKAFRKAVVVLIPEMLPQITSFLFIGIGSAILTESSVSFFGLGIRYPYSTWGLMLSDNTTVNELSAHPSIWIPTVVLISLTVLGFYFLGENISREKDFEDYYNLGRNTDYRQIKRIKNSDDILKIEKLTVEFTVNGKKHIAVNDFSMSLKRGESVALVGVSGCGKTVTADVITGLLSGNGVVKNGSVEINMISQSRCGIGYILQEPMACLDPVMTVGKQLEESLTVALLDAGQSEKYTKVTDMLKCVGFSEPEKIYRMYPGQLSGGMCQRIMAASVLLQSPELIIADEPCSSLDTSSKLKVLNLFRESVDKGASLIIITHNINEAKYVTDNIISFDGIDRVNSDNSMLRSFAKRSKELRCDDICLTVNNVFKTYRNSKSNIRALADVSFELKRGSILGITGDEGSGKTTLAGVISGIVRTDSGKVIFYGEDISKIKAAKRKSVRGKIQLIFQHPYNSLSKTVCVGKQIREVVRSTGMVPRNKEYDETVKLLYECGLDESFYYRYADTLSGGQCKRVCIARAIASNPDILICDEPLAYLDTDLHSQIIQLLRYLTEKRSVSLIFISHDIDSLCSVCNEVIIMDKGRIIEKGTVEKVFSKPDNICTKRMIDENKQLKNGV